MAYRSNESPMDFQWQTGYGPSSADSPFISQAANRTQSHNGLAGHKRDFDHFDSPKKPSLPMPRNSGSQSYTFPSTPTTKDLPQFRKPSFTTPQRQIDIDFSSGPENQSSPLADNEDTPEQPARSNIANTNGALVTFEGNRLEKKSPTKSIFGNYAVAGRGELPRRHHHDAVARRVVKRRRRDVEGRDVRLARRRPSDETDYEDYVPAGSNSSPSKFAKPPQTMGTIPSILTFMHAHPDLPDILSRYAQFILNLFFVALLIFVVYCFLATVRSDVDEASREVAAETMAEMVACTREFKSNKCDGADRVPAMESMCNSWQKCMDRDPAMVGRARVSAQTFAEIITSFAEGISYKTMLFCSIIFLGCWGISNVSMTIFRHKIQHSPPPYNPQMGGVPNTVPMPGPYFQYPQQALGQEGSAMGMESPGKQLGYR